MAEDGATAFTTNCDYDTAKTDTEVPKELSDFNFALAGAIEHYFSIALIVIGVVGIAANGFVLYALFASRQVKKRAVNILIIHQNILDVICCALLVITFSLNLASVHVSGLFGYVLCTTVMSETALGCSICASTLNLMLITVERYLKIVHSIWSRKHLRRWMIYVAIAIAWLLGIATITVPAFTMITMDENGYCLGYTLWSDPVGQLVYSVLVNNFYFTLPLFVFFYCYGHILFTMRRQARIMQTHNTAGSTQATAAQIQSNRIKANIVKTMILVSGFFLIFWLPNTVYYIFVSDNPTATYIGYNASLLLGYINICTNPFIYAASHDEVKRKVKRLLFCCKRNDVMNDETNTGSSSARRIVVATVHVAMQDLNQSNSDR